MNITDFEEYFSPRILERGKEYYRNHHVITLDRIEEGYYEAEVEGSQIYTVFVELEENGEISEIALMIGKNFASMRQRFYMHCGNRKNILRSWKNRNRNRLCQNNWLPVRKQN